MNEWFSFTFKNIDKKKKKETFYKIYLFACCNLIFGGFSD